MLSTRAASEYLIGQLGLRKRATAGVDGASSPERTRTLLRALRCIQLDPLDRVGTNADLVVQARLDGVSRGDVYDHLLPGHAFEHFAKERCLLPPEAFPYYRDQAVVTPWWRLSQRLARLPAELIDSVEAEVRERGPLTARELTDHGRVQPLDWHGWKGTARATSMALEVLWVQCRIVVCGRTPAGKRYDVPERALPEVAERETTLPFAEWALLERVEAAGLLSRAAGPWWSMLKEARGDGTIERLLERGAIEEVTIEGSGTTRTPRRYLAPAGFRERAFPADDGRMRVLGPLDPLIWNRALVGDIFDFEYVWEVYKPAGQRRWGYYVCPLLQHGRLVGRFEGHTERTAEGSRVVVVDSVWPEEGEQLDEDVFAEAISRLQ